MNVVDVIAGLLDDGHSVRFRATGHSMHPLIRNGDYVLVVPATAVTCGDVVLALLPRGLTAHRVVSAANGVVVTRGDNAPGDDEPASRVLGVVTHVEREGRLTRVSRSTGLLLGVRRLCGRLLIRAAS